MNQLLTFKNFLLLIIALTMYNNLEHSAQVYYELESNTINTSYSLIRSYFVVIVIDFVVIAFIVKARMLESKVFAWTLFFVNMIYYDTFTNFYQLIISTDPDTTIEATKKLLSKVIFSGLFSYTLHSFSALYYHNFAEQSNIEQLKAQVEQLKAEVEQLKAEVEQEKADATKYAADLAESKTLMSEKLSTITALNSRIKQYQKDLTCLHCNTYIAENLKGLKSHQGVCKKKQKKALVEQ